MQGLTGKRSDPGPTRAAASDVSPGARAIDRIADHRVSAISEMHPDLMRSAGGETAFEERRLRVERTLYTIVCDRGLSPTIRDNSHLFAVDGAAADIAGDLSGGWCWHTPNDRGVGTVHLA